MGSPPLARGKVTLFPDRHFRPGITPACAGKSGCRRIFLSACQDHPRLRGEKIQETRKENLRRGSPPLARGKGRRPHPCRPFGRITPACAGKRKQVESILPDRGDHPRLRGEKTHTITVNKAVEGSPPLARGKASMGHDVDGNTGITPACAGKSPGSIWPAGPAQDHPRLRGEKQGRKNNRRYRRGSPPLARGKGFKSKEQLAFSGITPACAGKS